jgi:hypothetical protein
MKKKLVVLLGVMSIAAFAFAGCGSEQTAGSSNSTQQSESDAAGGTDAEQDDANTATVSGTAAGYVFENSGVEIGVDMDVEPIIEVLGEAKSVFEEPSCAAQGTAYLYTYSGFEINTYPDGDNNLIAYILLKDDTVATPEGIDLSSSKEDVIAAYGDDYTEDDTKLTYEKDGMTLNFLLDGDSIVSIEYDSGVLN